MQAILALSAIVSVPEIEASDVVIIAASSSSTQSRPPSYGHAPQAGEIETARDES